MARVVARPRIRSAGVTDDERALFRTAVADVIPLECDRFLIEHPLPPAIARNCENDEISALAESLHLPSPGALPEGGDEAAWLRAGLPRRVLKDLRRGRWDVQAEVDLHGYNRDEARDVLAGFIARCLLRGARCLRIVHGKGLRSPGREPILKNLVRHWLQHRREILAFCPAPNPDGGSGALLVLLAANH